MEVLFLTQTYPRYPGDTAGPFIREIARALVRAGDRVTVLAPHAEGVPPAWDDDGVVVETFRYAPEAWEVLGYSRSLEKDETVRAGAGWVAPLYALSAARAVRRAALRAATNRRPFDLVHAHWVLPNGPPAALGLAGLGLGGRLAGRPPVLAIGLHGSDVFLAERPVLRTAAAWSLGRASLLTGCSPELVDRVCQIGFPREKSHVIPYGIDTDVYSPSHPTPQPPTSAEEPTGGRRLEVRGPEQDPAPPTPPAAWRQRLGVPADAPLVLSVGRMATKKGYHVLFEAFPRLLREAPDAHWVLAGAGDLLDDFRRRASELPGGDRIHLPGIVERDTLPDLFRAADLFVLPAVHDSRGNVDGLPNVILEAMGTGLPVVASDVSGIPLAVEHRHTGLLVPEQQPAPLAEALLSLLRDSARRRAYGRAGRARAVTDLTWDAITARYREAYRTAVGTRTSAGVD